MCWPGADQVPPISLHWIQDGKSSHLWIMPITKGMDLELIKINNQCSMISERLTDFTLKDVLFFKANTKLTWF